MVEILTAHSLTVASLCTHLLFCRSIVRPCSSAALCIGSPYMFGDVSDRFNSHAFVVVILASCTSVRSNRSSTRSSNSIVLTWQAPRCSLVP